MSIPKHVRVAEELKACKQYSYSDDIRSPKNGIDYFRKLGEVDWPNLKSINFSSYVKS